MHDVRRAPAISNVDKCICKHTVSSCTYTIDRIVEPISISGFPRVTRDKCARVDKRIKSLLILNCCFSSVTLFSVAWYASRQVQWFEQCPRKRMTWFLFFSFLFLVFSRARCRVGRWSVDAACVGHRRRQSIEKQNWKDPSL